MMNKILTVSALLFLMACNEPSRNNNTNSFLSSSSADSAVNKEDVTTYPVQRLLYNDSDSAATKVTLTKSKKMVVDSFNLKDALLKKGLYFGTFLSVGDINLRSAPPG